MFCSLEKLKIGMSASLLFGLFLTAHGEWIYGRLKSKYLVSKGKDMTWEECGNMICAKDDLDCQFAHTDSKKCYQIYFPLELVIKWFWNILPEDENMKIYYFYTDLVDIMTDKPRVWWFLDNVSKGRNIGSAGPALDIPVGSVVWQKEGPRAGSPLLYARGKKFEKVALKHNGNLLLDMVGPFTISMWVKMDFPRWGNPMLLSSLPKVSTRFMFWPSNNLNQLVLAFGGEDNHYTTLNNAGRNQWRHFAVAYNPGSSPIFFLNGDVWPLQNDPGDVKKKIQPTHLVLWDIAYRTKYSDTYILRGEIACLMVFQAPLSQSQIKILKDNCP